ncbi:MAG: cysteine desulfurase family protein [Acutalibacteraceae bacterium]
MTAYLDNSATTKVCDEAIEKMCSCMKECWGNPSSSHFVGIEAYRELESAREAVASALFCQPKEIFFTSGGTESNNLAIKGAADKLKRRGNKIITTAIEHPSVASVCEKLRSGGFNVVALKPGRDARISLEELEKEIDEDTVLVSVMAVNNEVGSIQPFDKIKSIIKRKNSPALLHVDAVQAFGKLTLRPKSDGIDLMTVSSHKIHGPKGAGALFVADTVKINPVTLGGEQEKKLRPGTEAMPAIVGFGEAVRQLGNINGQLKKMSSLRNDFLLKLKGMQGVSINSPDDALPYIVNISVDGLRSEPVLNLLSDMGVCVSSGSACAKGRKSHVLEALGLPPERVDSAIRISMSRYTTEEELELFIKGIETAQKVIRRR